MCLLRNMRGDSLNNIDLVDGKPVKEAAHTVWPVSGGGGCPAEAIEYKLKSKGQHRHYTMDNSFC